MSRRHKARVKASKKGSKRDRDRDSGVEIGEGDIWGLVQQRFDIPIIMGTTTDEGTVFVFTAYPTRMTKFVYRAVVIGFFRAAAPRVLKQYVKMIYF